MSPPFRSWTKEQMQFAIDDLVMGVVVHELKLYGTLRNVSPYAKSVWMDRSFVDAEELDVVE